MNAPPLLPSPCDLFVTSYGDGFHSISLNWNLHMFLAWSGSFLSCIFARDPAKGLHANQLGSFEEGRITQCSSWDCVRGLWVSWGSKSMLNQKLIKCLSLYIYTCQVLLNILDFGLFQVSTGKVSASVRPWHQTRIRMKTRNWLILMLICRH